MAIYTVLARGSDLSDAEAFVDGSVFVKNGFSVLAAAFPALWLIWNRLWLELLAYGLALLGLYMLSGVMHPVGLVILHSLVVLYLALEATSLHTSALLRRGYKELGVVTGHDREECEARFLSHWFGQLDHPATMAVKSSASTGRPVPSDGIIGLFPQPEAKG
ncbi:DUF2628 domain-containing protein [Coralliovum pocilloporae]|uniref:DUF2628 domain-containing protein n=1 Tax=Coralliovum pocilloporae TaxID=3066369 RepID=UPI0033070C81